MVYSFTHLIIFSFTHLLIYSFTHLLIYSFTHLLIYSFDHLIIYSFTHLLICSFAHLLIYSFACYVLTHGIPPLYSPLYFDPLFLSVSITNYKFQCKNAKSYLYQSPVCNLSKLHNYGIHNKMHLMSEKQLCKYHKCTKVTQKTQSYKRYLFKFWEAGTSQGATEREQFESPALCCANLASNFQQRRGSLFTTPLQM